MQNRKPNPGPVSESESESESEPERRHLRFDQQVAFESKDASQGDAPQTLLSRQSPTAEDEYFFRKEQKDSPSDGE